MPDIAGRADLEMLLRAFYARALHDPLLRPIFVDVAHMDLEAHLPVITDFWQKVLWNEGVYTGRTMRVHRQLHARAPLSQAHFDRWLQLWGDTLAELFSGPVADQALGHARRIASVMVRQLHEPRPVLRPLTIVAR